MPPCTGYSELWRCTRSRGSHASSRVRSTRTRTTTTRITSGVRQDAEDYRVKIRYILPLESKQYVPQQVIVMKPIECMVVHRDLVVWGRER